MREIERYRLRERGGDREKENEMSTCLAEGRDGVITVVCRWGFLRERKRDEKGFYCLVSSEKDLGELESLGNFKWGLGLRALTICTANSLFGLTILTLCVIGLIFPSQLITMFSIS